MQTSESIKELTAALAKAQGEFDAVSKTGHNPFLKNTYATLDDIIGAIRGPLSKHGIAFMQPLTGNGEGFVLETVLMHESGEWLSCAANVPSNAGSKGTNELQSFGGALTYMRRYMLSALLGINAEEDTDGNGKQAAKPTAKGRPARRPETATDYIRVPYPDGLSGQGLLAHAVTVMPFENVGQCMTVLAQVHGPEWRKQSPAAQWETLDAHCASATVQAEMPLAEEVPA